MSQSRNRARRTTSRSWEMGTGAKVASPSDFVTENTQNGSKSTNKISKELRYDLENALLGLCDVWFDEIKPYLVKNNLKVHTGGALHENGYGDRGLAGEHGSGPNQHGDGRRDLDPGAASDCQKRPVNWNSSSPTRHAESRTPCRRRPAPSHRTPLNPGEFHNLLQNISSRSKPRRKARTRRESQTPPLPTQPPVTRVMHPRCTACGFVSQGPASNTPQCNLSDRIPRTWYYATSTQRPLLRPNKFVLSPPHYSRFLPTQSYPDSNRLSRIDSVNERSNRCDATKYLSPQSYMAKSQLNAKIPTPENPCCTVRYPPHYARDSPYRLRSARISPTPYRSVSISRSPLRTTGIPLSSFQAPSVSPPCPSDAKPLGSQQPVSSSPPPRPSNVDKSGAPFLKRTSENNWISKLQEQIRPQTRKQTVYNLRPASSRLTIFPVKHEIKKPFEDESSLFPKDLIDIIEEKYDTRFKVLYKNPKREESYPSIMNLAGCRKTKNISTTTQNPWR